MKILVTGANGQLGKEIQLRSKQYDHQFVFTDVDTLDITDLPLLTDYCLAEQFRFIINCAGYTAVDKAEEEQDKAFLINKEGTFNLVEAAATLNIPIIHISTDYVFDGKNYKPYSEEDPVYPISVYGKSKAEGERFVFEYAKGIIIRTSWLYSQWGNNFVKTMLRLSEQKEEIGVVYDQIGSPTWAGSLAQAILDIVDNTAQRKKKLVPGIYHYTDEGVASWYDFAKAIFEIANKSIKVNAIETSEYPTAAARPFYSVLNKKKIKQVYGVQIPYWRDSLKKVIEELRASEVGK